MRLCENGVMREDEIRKIVKPMSIPEEFEEIDDPVIRNFITAITTTGNPPWSCLILTSKKHESVYKSNKNYDRLRDIGVQCAGEAYQTIKLMFNLFSNERRG